MPLRDWLHQFPQRHADLGTGDGHHALYLARTQPRLGVLAVDSCLDHIRGAARNRPANLRFVTADACTWDHATLPPVGSVSINFPYGSLLRGLVSQDERLQTAIARLLADGGTLEVRINASALSDLGLPFAQAETAVRGFAQALPGARLRTSPLTRDDLRAFPSTWARRLGYGRHTEGFVMKATLSTGSCDPVPKVGSGSRGHPGMSPAAGLRAK